jgi:hypothetical protein
LHKPFIYLSSNKKDFSENYTIEFDILLQSKNNGWMYPELSFGLFASKDEANALYRCDKPKFFYILVMSNTMKSMQPVTYIELRKLRDKCLQNSLKAVYYLALTTSILLVSFYAINPSGFLFTCLSLH